MPHPALLKSIDELIHHLLAFERRHTRELHALDAAWADSARNLLHYLAMRQRDLRELQLALTQSGLSSLGRSEGGGALDARWRCERGSRATVHATGESPRWRRLPAARRWSRRRDALARAHPRPLRRPPRGATRVRHGDGAVGARSRRGVDGGDARRGHGRAAHQHGARGSSRSGRVSWRRCVRRERARGSTVQACWSTCRARSCASGRWWTGSEVLKLKPPRDALGRTTTPFRVTLAPRAWIGQTHSTAGPTLFVDDRWLDEDAPG
jgi:pyruvate kinase